MRTEEIRKMGDLAKTREFVRQIEKMLEFVADPNSYMGMDEKTVEAVENDLLHTRMCFANIMSKLGDHNAYYVDIPRRMSLKKQVIPSSAPSPSSL